MSRVWVRPDGVVDEETAAAPVRFRDAAAEHGWREIDTSIVRRGSQFVAAQMPVEVSVGVGSEPVVRFGSEVELRLPGVVLPEPAVGGSTALYRDVFPGVDVRVELRSGGFELLWVVKSAQGAAGLVQRFAKSGSVELPLQVVAGGKLVAGADGSVGVLDGRGQRRGVFGSPVMWDSHASVPGERGVQKPVGFRVGAGARSSRGLATAVSVAADVAWLTARDRRFPLYVDPTYGTVSGNAVFDTFVQSNMSADESGSSELRLGTYGSGVVARSFMNFNASLFKGRTIISGTLSLYETWSWSCDARAFVVYDAAVTSAATRWSNQPGAGALRGTTSVAKGFSSACPAGRVSVDITSAAKAWQSTSASQVGLTLRAGDETTVYGWKKFASSETANKPFITVSYNRVPPAPAAPSVATASWLNSKWYVGTNRPSFSVVASDPDLNMVAVEFASFTSATSTASPTILCGTAFAASGGTHSCQTGAGLGNFGLAENTSVWVRARAKDSMGYGAWSAPTQVIVASKTPPTPTVTCPTANGSWGDDVKAAETCTVTLTANSGEASSGPIKVKISKNLGAWSTQSVTQAQPGAPVTVSVTGVGGVAGAHSVRAIGVSPTGKESAIGSYGFGYGTPSLTSPASVTSTTGAVSVVAQGAPKGGAASVTTQVQWRVKGSTDTQWVAAPGSNMFTTTFGAAETTVSGRFDLASLIDQADGSGVKVAKRISTVIDVRVCFTYAGSGTKCTPGQQVVRVPHAFGSGFPVADAGVGKRASWTGEFQLSDTDAELNAPGGGISVSRVHSSFAGTPAVQDGVFGPGWIAAFEAGPVGLSGSEVVDATRADGTIVLLDADGSVLVFAAPGRRTGSNLTTGTYTPIDPDTEASGLRLAVSGTGAGTEIKVTDEDGVVTRFTVKTAPTAGTDAVFTVADVTDTVTTGKATYTYDTQGRVSAIVAPLPTGTGPCTVGTPANGCRVLRFGYAATTTATGTSAGDFAGQVKSITADVNTTSGIQLATYKYDSTGRLVSATDSRTGLTTTYTWTGTAQQPLIASITPPGQAPFNFTYSDGKLFKVTRPVPASAGGGTAQLAAFVDNVQFSTITDLGDVTGQFADYNLNRTATTGFATFGPDTPIDHAPAAGADMWRKADLQLTDPEGYTIHSASYGAGQWQFTATEYDQYDNVIRAWDSRATAAIRNPGDSGIVDIDSAATCTVYNDDIKAADGTVLTPAGTLVTDVYTPAARVITTDGTEASLRRHVRTFYDEAAPNNGINPATNTPYRLATRVVTTAETVTGEVIETLNTTWNSYGPVVAGDKTGWELGQATTVTTDMNGNGTKDAADITKVTRYDTEGRTIEQRQPTSTGTDAGTRQTVHYTAGPNPTAAVCGSRPEWAGWVCRVGPAAQPAGMTLPVTVTTGYRWDGQATTITETSGAVTRTTTTSYDTKDRPVTVTTTVTALTGSEPVPPVTTTYDDNTGNIAGTTSSAGTTGFTYDNWGRQLTYTNHPTGQTTPDTTTTTYNQQGQTTQTADNNGTTTYTWDGTDANGDTETRNLITSVTVTTGTKSWTSTGAYDPHGTLTRENLPGQIIRRTSYDLNGELIQLTYNGQVTNPDTEQPEPDQPWIAWSLRPNPTGQTAHEWTPDGAAFTGDLPGTQATTSNRNYTYDKAGRLITVQDRTGNTTNTDTTCTLRTYTFDPNGNRTAQSTATADPNTDCPTTPTQTTTRAYDAADRPTTGGNNTGTYTYDQLGRQTLIPNTDTPNPADGNITLGYYHTDAAHTITQNGQTLTYTLDSAGRRQTQTTQTPNLTTTNTNHYTNTSDNPTWTVHNNNGTTTTNRYAPLINGTYDLTITNNTTAELTIPDARGGIAATVTLPTTGPATGLDTWNTYDEYGNTQSPITADPTGATSNGYGWLGTQQRTTTTTGLQLMGARNYNPTTGLFTSLDPVFGGNETAYGYPNDPIGKEDSSGLEPWWNRVRRHAVTAATCAAMGAVKCAAVGYAVRVATEFGNRVADGSAFENRANAIRHFVFVGLMYATVGWFYAKKIADAHELGLSQHGTTEEKRDSVRDRINNDLTFKYMFSRYTALWIKGNLRYTNRFFANHLFSVSKDLYARGYFYKRTR